MKNLINRVSARKILQESGASRVTAEAWDEIEVAVRDFLRAVGKAVPPSKATLTGDDVIATLAAQTMVRR